jgi:hypothetical protein
MKNLSTAFPSGIQYRRTLFVQSYEHFVLAAVQWRNSAIQTSAGCLSMVGDMFNNSLKSKLDAVCTELAAYVADTPSTDQEGGREEVSYHSARQHSDWWPINLGTPSAVGAQNALQYAVFPGTSPA